MADIIDFAPCFRYPDPNNGDLVTKGPITDYVKRIAIQVCSLITSIKTQQSINTSFNERLGTLESKSTAKYVLPNIYPICIGSSTELLPLDEFTVLLENKFCEMLSAVGSTTAIYNAITTPPSDFNSAKALGTSGGVMGTLAGWVQDPKTLSDSFTNLWITLLDARSAIRNIQINCCNTSCGGIGLTLIGTLESKILKLFFTGTIPSTLTSCVIGGSTFRISDQSGNAFTIVVDVQGNLNNISGVSIDLNSTSLNFADDLDVHGITCFSDPNTGTVCQSCLEITVDNNSNCPPLVLVPGLTSVSYSFVHTSGTLTYSIQIFDSNNVMVQSVNESVTSTVTIIGTFSGLNSNSIYRVRVQMITASNTKTCPFISITTLTNPCPAPTGLVVTLVY